jgi:hypothetical protein
MLKTSTRLLSFAFAIVALASCGDGGGSSGSRPGTPSDPDTPRTAEPVPPPLSGGPADPGARPTRPREADKPKTADQPSGRTPTLEKLPWERRGAPDRPRNFDDVPSGFTNVPRPEGPGGADRPETPTEPDPRLRPTAADPDEGLPPVEPGDDPAPGDEPRTPGSSGDAADTRADRRVGGGPTEKPLPPLHREIPGADVPAVFAPRSGAPEPPARPPIKTLAPGEGTPAANQPRDGGEGRRPGEPVPEPETYVLFALGAGFVVWSYRKHATRHATA